MKNESIEVIHTNIPLKKSYKLSQLYDVIQTTGPVFVKIHTDEGITGIGETDPMPHFTDETAETIMEILKNHIGPAVCGMNPSNIAAIHDVMDCCIKGNSLAKAVIDMACYDLAGKAVGIPVHDFLGGKMRDDIPVMWALGDDDPMANAEEAVLMVRKGYGTLMVKVGNRDVKRDAARVREIRKSVGGEVFLIVDANQGWDVETSVRFAQMIEDYNIALFEQPVRYWDFVGMAKIKRSINIPISADESLFTIHDAVQLVIYDAVDVFSIKVAKNGGIYKAKKIMDFAEANNIRCLMNSLIEEGVTQSASLHLGISAINMHDCGHAYFSPLRLQEDISDYSLQLDMGRIDPGNKPGLGVAFDEGKLRKYQVHRFEIKSS